MYRGNVIVRPLITEKSMKESEKGRYTFAVNLGADKTLIKRMIEDQFGVNIVGIVTSRIKGRSKRVGVRRMEVTSSPFKKATVTLKGGQKIDIFTVGK